MSLGTSFFFPIFWALSFLGFSEGKTPLPHGPALKNHGQLLLEQLGQSHSQPPSLQVLEVALSGYTQLKDELKNQVLTVIDFTLPSTQKRLWIIDMAQQKVLLHTVVAHGRNSGLLLAERFSNLPESYQSSLGFYKTAETYQGKHGYSLRLDGLEKGINDQARKRAIVIHGAAYASEQMAATGGRLGRSLGCPAVPEALAGNLIRLIKEGSLLFIYGKDPSYLQQSRFWPTALPA